MGRPLADHRPNPHGDSMSRTAGRLGWMLVWAVVFANVGASVYFVPGFLRGGAGSQAGLYVLALMAALVVLARKEVETIRRFPSGGGAVSVAERAFGPWWGCLTGQLLLVDFFLTVAISAASALHYAAALLPLGGSVLPAAVACLGLLCVVNVIGLKESAALSLTLAGAALGVDLVVIGVGLVSGPSLGSPLLDAVVGLAALPGREVLLGVGGAWLALAGLESMSLLAPAMRDLGATPRRTTTAVVVSVMVTAPALTLLCTLGPPPGAGEEDRLVAALAAQVGGPLLEAAVVLTAASLLMLCANAAIISGYHVSGALAARGFLPESLGELSRRFQTPTRAIVVGTLVPVLLLVATGADVTTLAELYAFGFLGALAIGGVAMDVLHWREGERGAAFWGGAVVSVAVVVSFVANLVLRPAAAEFGTMLTVLGMVVARATRSGWFGWIAARLPGFRLPELVSGADVPFLTLAQAGALSATGESAPGILVASRGASPKLFQEAVERARSRGAGRIFLLYVDEVPGLFYPQLVSPTDEGLAVLESGCGMIRASGLTPIPVWTISHSAATSVAEAAESCGCDTVVVGATQRTVLWQALRGRFIQEVLKQLPPEIRLIVVG